MSDRFEQSRHSLTEQIESGSEFQVAILILGNMTKAENPQWLDTLTIVRVRLNHSANICKEKVMQQFDLGNEGRWLLNANTYQLTNTPDSIKVAWELRVMYSRVSQDHEKETKDHQSHRIAPASGQIPDSLVTSRRQG